MIGAQYMDGFFFWDSFLGQRELYSPQVFHIVDSLAGT